MPPTNSCQTMYDKKLIGPNESRQSSPARPGKFDPAPGLLLTFESKRKSRMEIQVCIENLNAFNALFLHLKISQTLPTTKIPGNRKAWKIFSLSFLSN